MVVRDPERKDQIAKLSGDQSFIREAPVFIAWCADRNRLDGVSQRQGYRQVTDYVEDFLVAAIDVAIAMQNATVAAESFGLGTCYVGALRNNTAQVIDLLQLPPLVFPVAGMTIGHPAARAQPKPRLDQRAFMHMERYTATDSSLVDQYDDTIRETGLYTGRQTAGIRVDGRPADPISEADYSWSEHSARRASIAGRTELRAVLESQGFLLS